MDVSRRVVLGGAAAAVAAPGLPSIVAPIALPDRTNFQLDRTFLNAAYVHPMGRMTYDAIEAFLQRRMRQPTTPWPGENDRDKAVALFARLINADPADIAVVPSTMEGENLIAASLGLGPNAGVVTDAFHYSPEIYGEYGKRGVPVAVARPRHNRIEVADIDRLIDGKTRLVAVSEISSDTGFRHDIKALASAAHSKGALVFADIVQAAGAVPIDVKDSSVDFCCCGGYKWLMGDFGAAFLYVRPNRLKELKRVQFGWRQYKSYVSHVYPLDPLGAAAIDYTLRDDTIGRFEVSTPSWSTLSGLAASLAYIRELGVDHIVEHRAPLMERLQAELPRYGFAPLTPADTATPAIAFTFADAATRLKAALVAARIDISLYRNRIRIAPSVYNDAADIERLIKTLAQASR